MSREFGLELIDKSRFGVIMMNQDEPHPYGIPLSIARDGNVLYFHSAMEGKKVTLFKDHPAVSVVFVGDGNPPELYSKEELDEIAADESKFNLLVSTVFTSEFESAIVTGKVELVSSEEERIKGMEVICKKYTPTKMAYFEQALEAGWPEPTFIR